MERFFVSIFLFLIAFHLSSGQSVTGSVMASDDSKPVPGAIIRTLGEDGKTLKYVMTDRNGKFIIETGAKAKTLMIALLGYKEQSFDAPFKKDYEIFLERSSERIKESVVQARKVKMAGDTTTYNVKALTTREDLVLGDVLKRIPGIEVTPSGHLKVDGKDLGKFYVNGKDVLEGNYNLATKRLSVDAVKKVEVLRNHQYIKMLQGMQESDMAAVNIVLDEKAKGKVKALGSISGGYQAGKPVIPHSENLTAFYLGDGFSSVNDAGYDASGKPNRDITYFRLPLSDNRYSIQSKLNIASANAPLSDSRSLFNKTLDTRTVNTLTPSDAVKVGATFAYSWDDRNSSNTRTSTYHLADGTDRIIQRNEERLERGSKLTGRLSFSNNARKSYVNEVLFADLGKQTGVADVTGDDIRSQRGGRKTWDMNNSLNTLFKVSSGRSIGIKSYTQLSGFFENLDILSGNPRQGIKSSALFQDLSFNNIRKTKDNVTLSLQPSLKWTLFERDSRLTGIGDEEAPGLKEDHSRASYFTGGFTWSLFYRKKAFSLELNGNLHYDKAVYGSYHNGKLIPDESISAKYETGRVLVSAGAGISTSRPDIQDLGSVLILYDYDGLRRGQESLSFLPNRFVSCEFIFREPVSGWHTRLTSRYQKTRSLLGGRDVLENYILSYNTDETIAYGMWSSSAEITKGMYSINGKISFKVSDFHTESVFRQNGTTTDYVSNTLAPSLEINSSPLGFWNINGSASLSFMRMTSGRNVTGNTRNIRMEVTNSLYISDKVSAGIVTDLFHNSTVGKTIVFPDVFITVKGPDKLRLRLQASNLLNYKEYSYVSISPLMETSYSYRIRPFSIILHADRSF